jgi:hypothetical protein
MDYATIADIIDSFRDGPGASAVDNQSIGASQDSFPMWNVENAGVAWDDTAWDQLPGVGSGAAFHW